MLPTTGFFKDIECPYHNSTCGRPYCHFRHRKKNSDTNEDGSQNPAVPEVPTYKPTPKSELASTRTHIPISYVPDVMVRSERTFRPLPSFSFDNKPIYKPTPLSQLPKTIKNDENKEAPNGDQNNHKKASEDQNGVDECSSDGAEEDQVIESSKCEVTASETKTEKEADKTSEIDFEGLTNEFNLIDEILTSSNEVEEEDSGSVEKVKKHSNDVKSKDRSSSSKSKSDKTKSSNSKRDRKHHSSEKKHKDSDKSKDKDKKLDKKHKSSSSSRDDRKSIKSRSKSHSKSEKSEEKEKSDGDSHKSKKHQKQKSKDKERRKSSDNGKESSKYKSDSKSKEKKEKSKDKSGKKSGEVINSLFEDDEDDDVEAECYRIFNEYKSDVPEYVPEDTSKATEVNEVEYIPTKKRIAHEKAEGQVSKVSYVKPNAQQSAAQQMANRFKLARIAQAENEQLALMNEIHKGVKRKSTEPEVKIIKKQIITKEVPKNENKASTCLVDDILSNKSKPIHVYTISSEAVKSKPRIAPVQNVNSIQKAKARILEVKLKSNQMIMNKTSIQTNSKGAKRVAHIPDISLSDIPDVLKADKSKLPVNVRTRYLTTIADECVKLYVSKSDAYNRALNEELKCYEKCSALITYRNSAMLAVNRIRKELQERVASGLGPFNPGDSGSSQNISVNKGKAFYDNICGYILTEEQLEENGYPRDSSVPGRASIKTQKTARSSNLESNQRMCCRCGKIYLVDCDGFVLYKEECLYHPLKKRTLRGERTYLCCKSSDDTGCVTSNTHVSESEDNRELEGFQTTMEPEDDNDSRSFAVYALDCEMCYTTKGLELTRVTIVDPDCKTVYESLVKPINPIIDYNTRFSGITKEQMDKTSTSILQVQANILHLCNSKTILIGHSLESDMKALKIIHSTIIDTAILFPHKFGLPHKRALRALASEYLKKIIQNDVSGHDSAEDAITCMELVNWKLKEDLKIKGIRMK